MRRIKWYVVANYGSHDREEGTFEVPDDTKDDDIEEMVRDAVHCLIDWGWKELKNEQGEA